MYFERSFFTLEVQKYSVRLALFIELHHTTDSRETVPCVFSTVWCSASAPAAPVGLRYKLFSCKSVSCGGFSPATSVWFTWAASSAVFSCDGPLCLWQSRVFCTFTHNLNLMRHFLVKSFLRYLKLQQSVWFSLDSPLRLYFSLLSYTVILILVRCTFRPFSLFNVLSFSINSFLVNLSFCLFL
jgi:hypothetical protein